MYTELDSNSESRGRRGVKHEPHAIRQLVLRRRSGTTHSVGAFCRSFFLSGSRPKWKGAARGNNVILLPTWKSFGRSCLPGCHFLSPAGGVVALRARGHVGAERAPAGAQPPARARRRGTKAPSTKCATPPQPTLVPARACARLRVLLMAPPPLSHRPPDALCQPQHTHVQGFSLSAVRPARRRSSRAKSARRRLGRRRAAAACAAGPWPQRRSLSASAGGALSARPPRQRRRQRWGRRWITWLRDSPRESGTPRPA